MVSGKGLSTETKELIYDHHTDADNPKSAEDIYAQVYRSNNKMTKLSI